MSKLGCFRALGALSLLVLAGACGGDTKSALDAGGDGVSPGACNADKLVGTWTSTNYSVGIESDLSYVAAGAPNLMTIQVQGQLTADGCTLRFADTGGTFACPSAQVGVYTFTVTDTTLHLTAVSDPCDGRRIPVNGATLTRS